MKIKKILIGTVLFVLAVCTIAGVFMMGVRYARMQDQRIQSEFYDGRAVQPGDQLPNSKPTPKPGVASNPVMQMFHDMVGIPPPGEFIQH